MNPTASRPKPIPRTQTTRTHQLPGWMNRCINGEREEGDRESTEAAPRDYPLGGRNEIVGEKHERKRLSLAASFSHRRRCLRLEDWRTSSVMQFWVLSRDRERESTNCAETGGDVVVSTTRPWPPSKVIACERFFVLFFNSHDSFLSYKIQILKINYKKGHEIIVIKIW